MAAQLCYRASLSTCLKCAPFASSVGLGSPRRLPQSTSTARVPLNDWSSLEAGMSTSSRSYLRRKRKLADREGKVTIDVVSPDWNTVDRYLEEMFQVEAASWKSRTGTAIVQDQLRRQLWISYGRSAAKLGMLRIFFLRIGAATAAARLTVEFAGQLWELKIGYDERWAKCSPGILLMHETLRYACERGLKGYEFLGQFEPWQERWPIEKTQHATIGFYPLSFEGGVTVMYDTLSLVARKAVRLKHKLIRTAN